MLWHSNTENLACWTQKDVLYLGQQSFYPLKSAARASLERLMTIDSWHKPLGQQTTVFFQSPWAVKSSLQSLGFPSAQPNQVQGRLLIFALFCSVKCVDVADVCLLVHFRSVLYYEFCNMWFFVYNIHFEVNNIKMPLRANQWWPSWFRENSTVGATFFKETYWKHKKQECTRTLYNHLCVENCLLFFMHNCSNQMSISKAHGSVVHCQYEAETTN